MRVFLVVLHLAVVLPGCTESGRTADLKTRLTGRWFPGSAEEDAHEIDGCFCGRCLNIQFDKTDDSLCVESNQISVSAYYELDEANKRVAIYFKEPTDLGTGGALLPWDEFDRKKPIAMIDASGVDKNTLQVKWLGFTKKAGSKEKQSYGDFGGDYAGVYHKRGNK
ncbi:hypothetical protein [Archangium lansingense]|uniref:Lipoprotein n=1 Tax=Archangium lansingense TaxID=2995310 RepID=A0ABT4AP11_9BACT|nr:hypothetical protein [Archangium lansinium]MCY1083448.1 hypothetical protein [Archangium lansinium]